MSHATISLQTSLRRRTWCALSAAVVFFAGADAGANAGDLPPFFLNTVVALGGHVPLDAQTPKAGAPWFTSGTGFLYQKLIADPSGARAKLVRTYLVTAAHVVNEWQASNPQQPFSLRMNTNDPSKPIEIPISATSKSAGGNGWIFNAAGKDIALYGVNWDLLTRINSQVAAFNNDSLAADTAQMKDIGVTISDRVAVLGFPMNLAGVQRNYVIARFGSIARISDLFDHTSDTFLIDCFVFPGNSGGPVTVLPDINSIVGTKAINNAVLVGVLDSYLTYNDEAVSLQTHHPRVIFEENSGLAEVIPMDVVDQTIDQIETEPTAHAIEPATKPILGNVPPVSRPQ